ncbi:MAG: hypothetical protein JO359_13540 [Candidatus Eremiobacteraeota bacterium]|nr:hypothetical protein [Candidatus Eremiobacteraeota bacterium]
MSTRNGAVATALAALALVGAQYAFAGNELFHTWQYALALAILAVSLLVYVAGALRGEDGRIGRFVAVAALGALIALAAGLSSGLLGPDTLSVARVPGTVAPLPELGAAAFFSTVDPQALANGNAVVAVRRLHHTDIVVGRGGPKFLGSILLFLDPRPAAYVEATGARGRLTITQPSGSSFLSPVLLFSERQSIAGEQHPVDAFALPGRGLTVKVVYFFPSQTQRLHARVAGVPALLYDVFETSTQRPLGIGLGTSGEPVDVAAVRLRATVGTYPALVIASAPHPIAFAMGCVLAMLGLSAALAFLVKDHAGVVEAVRHEEQHRDREHRVRPRHQESETP